MKSLAINLKRIYLSPWNAILMVYNIMISIFVFVNANENCGQFIYYIFSFNIFLEIFTALLTVYMVRSTTEAEYGLAGRGKIIIVKYLASVIISLSYMPFIVIFLAVGTLFNSISAFIPVSYFIYYFCSTFAQVTFTVAFSLGIAYLINHKAAYFVCVLISMLFMPFIQTYVRKNTYDVDQSIFNLLNIVYDETYKIRYSGFGMPFNSETILSWIITVIAGVVILGLILLIKRCFRIKVNAILILVTICGITSVIPLVKLYLNSSPRSISYLWEETDEEFVYEAPAKVDICHTYSDERSPLIKKYEMNLSTGNIVRNDCVIYIDLRGNNSLRFSLDECFSIDELLLNGNKTFYSRNGDYFEVSDIPDGEEAVLSINYSGRLNYMDKLNNKTDFCDYYSGYLSDLFAWYPKILTDQNMGREKEFVISINAVNSFVTNLDEAVLHHSGFNTITGRETDVFFYIGYISSVEYKGKNIILPAEYENKQRSLESIIKLFDIGFLTREGKFSCDTLDIDPERYLTLSDEEIMDLLDEQNAKKWASDEQVRMVDTVLVIPVSYDFVLTSYIHDNYCFLCEYSLLKGE